ncbi:MULTISPECIES: hypothetical protein [unclassified Streptomyces]|uniref:hypothetical protein n=1 Tax=unclassified Streptomyces TaxID=2593676 RepID=UPI0013A6B9CA|nr:MULTISPECIES: hypothetical protein [unclassified Streptomyces]
MGGHVHAEQGRRGRPLLRRAVLLMAFGVLAGAAFLCARPAAEHAAGHQVVRVPGAGQVLCAAPHDVPGCSPLSHVTPAILPVPPSVAPVVDSGPAGPARLPDSTGMAGLPRALARGPDLYALQVLRT